MIEIFTREQAKASDKVLNDLLLDVSRKQQNLRTELVHLHYVVHDRREGYGSYASWKLTDEEAFAKAQALAANAAPDALTRSYAYSDEDKAARQLADIDEAEVALVKAVEAKKVQSREWHEHGMWPRYTVVPGGHIHRDETTCFTLRPTTDVRWAYPVSGDSVAEAVETYGEALCSHCFKDAPSNWVQRSKIAVDADGNPLTKAEAQAIKDAKAAEKQAKLDAKNAKRVIDPSTGTWILGVDGYELKTEVSVRNAILGALEDIRYYGDGVSGLARRGSTEMRSETVSRLVKALAAKRGVDAFELMQEFRAKDAKKARRY